MTGVSADDAAEVIRAFPGVEPATAFGDPAFTLRKTFFARLRDSGAVLALRLPIPDRELLLETAPEIYFVTDHYRAYPTVLVRLAAIDADELRMRVEQAWRAKATKTAVKAYDAKP